MSISGVMVGVTTTAWLARTTNSKFWSSTSQRDIFFVIKFNCIHLFFFYFVRGTNNNSIHLLWFILIVKLGYTNLKIFFFSYCLTPSQSEILILSRVITGVKLSLKSYEESYAIICDFSIREVGHLGTRFGTFRPPLANGVVGR